LPVYDKEVDDIARYNFSKCLIEHDFWPIYKRLLTDFIGSESFKIDAECILDMQRFAFQVPALLNDLFFYVLQLDIIDPLFSSFEYFIRNSNHNDGGYGPLFQSLDFKIKPVLYSKWMHYDIHDYSGNLSKLACIKLRFHLEENTND